jgi:hypothetical protein
MVLLSEVKGPLHEAENSPSFVLRRRPDMSLYLPSVNVENFPFTIKIRKC